MAVRVPLGTVVLWVLAALVSGAYIGHEAAQPMPANTVAIIQPSAAPPPPPPAEMPSEPIPEPPAAPSPLLLELASRHPLYPRLTNQADRPLDVWRDNFRVRDANGTLTEPHYYTAMYGDPFPYRETLYPGDAAQGGIVFVLGSQPKPWTLLYRDAQLRLVLEYPLD